MKQWLMKKARRILKIESPSELYATIGEEQIRNFQSGSDDPNGWDKLSLEEKTKFFEQCRLSARAIYWGED